MILHLALGASHEVLGKGLCFEISLFSFARFRHRRRNENKPLATLIVNGEFCCSCHAQNVDAMDAIFKDIVENSENPENKTLIYQGFLTCCMN